MPVVEFAIPKFPFRSCQSIPAPHPMDIVKSAPGPAHSAKNGLIKGCAVK
jgi:hypothetical protein